MVALEFSIPRTCNLSAAGGVEPLSKLGRVACDDHAKANLLPGEHHSSSGQYKHVLPFRPLRVLHRERSVFLPIYTSLHYVTGGVQTNPLHDLKTSHISS